MPSGNFGNICAGHVARMMGLPIKRLVLATNENNVLDEFFRTGTYRVRGSAETHETSSPSMDISKASNFERFVFDLLGRDAQRTRGAVPRRDREARAPSRQRRRSSPASPAYGFVSGSSTHADRLATIRDTAQRCGVVIDTHTADGLKVAREHREPGVPMIVLETALPAKFSGHHRRGAGPRAGPPGGAAGHRATPQAVQGHAGGRGQAVKEYIAQEWLNEGHRLLRLLRFGQDHAGRAGDRALAPGGSACLGGQACAP